MNTPSNDIEQRLTYRKLSIPCFRKPILPSQQAFITPIARYRALSGKYSQMKLTKAVTFGLTRRRVACSTHTSITGWVDTPQLISRPAARSSATTVRGTSAAPAPAATASRIDSGDDNRNTAFG